MDWRMILYYFCSAAGLVAIVGAIWLLSKQKIYLDKQTGAVVEFEVPLFGKLKTNVPSIGLVMIGAILLISPLKLMESLPERESPPVEVKGSVNSRAHPVLIYAVIRSQAMLQDGSFSLPMPQHMSASYDPKVLYVAANAQGVFDDEVQLAQQKSGEIHLLPKKLESSDAAPQLSQFANPVKPAPAEFLR